MSGFVLDPGSFQHSNLAADDALRGTIKSYRTPSCMFMAQNPAIIPSASMIGKGEKKKTTNIKKKKLASPFIPVRVGLGLLPVIEVHLHRGP